MKNEIKHTPGPWELTENRGVYSISTRTGNPLIHLKLASAEGAASYEANAELVAAAPAMREALELAKAQMEQYHCADCKCRVCTTIKKALEKAGGQ